MHRGLVVGGGAAIVVFVGALLVLRQGTRATSTPSSDGTTHTDVPRAPARPPAPSAPREASPRPPRLPGLKLGKERGPDARSKAQAILDDALAELRRLDDSHQDLARDVYMRGHSAAERIEDELDEGDEPGLARLRADEDAMKAELRRIYGVTDDP
ncbi:MAG: hypothetical protein ACE37F_33285 [Nannocystaceae bacterium]|nr:hypothetical protein [bacterium]